MRRAASSAWQTLRAGADRYRFLSIAALEADGLGPATRLPRSLKVVLENLLRHEDGQVVTREQVAALAAWPNAARAGGEVAFHPARVLMPDSSGIPLLADLAAMRDALAAAGGDPRRVDLAIPADLIVDHSVLVDHAGSPEAFQLNLELEIARNRERYVFLRWAERAFDNLSVVPPGSGICHQVNLEHLAQTIRANGTDAYPDSLVGTDSHTPMVNALGVLGWGVGGIDATAALLGEPVTMRVPEVVGCRLRGRLAEGVTATDLVLTLTERLRAYGVVGRFVEFFGPGLGALALPDRATVANMAPEFGATVAFFPIDPETLRYLRATGREESRVALVEIYARVQGLWHDDQGPDPVFSDVLDVNLAEVETSIAGPRRPQDRLSLAALRSNVEQEVARRPGGATKSKPRCGPGDPLRDGDIAIAAITSCTNTSNPGLLIGAGILARNAAARGLRVPGWVKTSLAPGSRVVTDYLEASGLQRSLDLLGFHLVGYGCTTCMGGSGPLREPVRRRLQSNERPVLAAVLSGNRNFEGRIHSDVALAYLASPPLVVAFALAGTVRIDLRAEPLGRDPDGAPVFLRDLWPDPAEVHELTERLITADAFRARYRQVAEGTAGWRALAAPASGAYPWDPESTYLRRPPFFDTSADAGASAADICDVRALVMLGDDVTTDHISPVGAIPRGSPAGEYLTAAGVAEPDFNTYLARRVNHEVMLRGAFANPRLRNEVVPGVEGGYTRHLPSAETLTIYDAAMRYAAEGTPLVVVAGKAYGAGSSRDWAAKGARLLGVRAVLAEGFERIHRANLVRMGILPLQFPGGIDRRVLRLDGSERFTIEGVAAMAKPSEGLRCRIVRTDGTCETIEMTCQIDTARELAYFRAGGVLQFLLRKLMRPD